MPFGSRLPFYEPAETEQRETFRRLICWFWYDLSHHFIIPLARKQFWLAYGAGEDLRLTCVMLARLRENYQAAADDYEKLEQALPVERLAPLEESFCPMEPVAMLQAALVIVYFYQQLAPPLAQAHGIPYPADLELVVSDRLEQACHVNINGKQLAFTYRHSTLLVERSGEVVRCALKVSLSQGLSNCSSCDGRTMRTFFWFKQWAAEK